MSRKTALALAFSISGVLLAHSASGPTQRFAAAVKKYKIVTNPLEVIKGLETTEDNAADLLHKMSQVSVPLSNADTNPEIYRIACEMAKRKNWYLKRDWSNYPFAGTSQKLSLINVAILNLMKSGASKCQKGSSEEGLLDIGRALKLASLLTKEPSLTGQLYQIALSNITLTGILRIVCQPQKSKMELDTLVDLTESLPEPDLSLGMRFESYVEYQLLKPMLADRAYAEATVSVMEYFGKCKAAYELCDLDEALARTRIYHQQLVRENSGNRLGKDWSEAYLQSDTYSKVILTALHFRLKKQMVSEGIRAIMEHRVPNAQRDWTGGKKDQTVVSGTAEDWTIVARGKDGVFNEKGYSQTNKEAPKDLFLIYRAGLLLLLSS